MKLCLALLTLLFPVLGWTQAVGGGGNTGGGVIMRNFRVGCIEGRAGWISVYTKGEARSERRICRDGSYMNDQERAAYIYNPKATCSEGAYVMTEEFNYNTRREENVVRLCRQNKWVIVRSY